MNKTKEKQKQDWGFLYFERELHYIYKSFKIPKLDLIKIRKYKTFEDYVFNGGKLREFCKWSYLKDLIKSYI